MNVLFLTHRLPYAPNRGDRVRAYHVVRSLASRVKLDVVSLAHDRHELAQTDQLKHLGARVTAVPVPRVTNYAKALAGLAGRQPLTHILLNAPAVRSTLKTIVRERRPDVVLAYCSSMARFAMETPVADCPLVLDLVDVDSEKWEALAQSTAWPKRAIYDREARYLGPFERQAANAAYATLVVNEREGDALRRLAPEAAVRVVPNGVDVVHLQPHTPPTEHANVVFCGVMNYEPNVEGVLWFARSVWPRIRSARPDARFFIVGSDPVKAVRNLASDRDGIVVTGAVPDVRAHLWNSAVSVAPLRTARGLQNKVLEALAAGLPAVITPAVLIGLPIEILEGCRVADDEEEFARHVLVMLAASGRQRRALAAAANVGKLSWDRQLEPLHGILHGAANRAPQLQLQL